jgi:hypothetical protein
MRDSVNKLDELASGERGEDMTTTGWCNVCASKFGSLDQGAHGATANSAVCSARQSCCCTLINPSPPLSAPLSFFCLRRCMRAVFTGPGWSQPPWLCLTISLEHRGLRAASKQESARTSTHRRLRGIQFFLVRAAGNPANRLSMSRGHWAVGAARHVWKSLMPVMLA